MANPVSDGSNIKLITVSALSSHSCRLIYFNLPSYYSDVILFHDVSNATDLFVPMSNIEHEVI